MKETKTLLQDIKGLLTSLDKRDQEVREHYREVERKQEEERKAMDDKLIMDMKSLPVELKAAYEDIFKAGSPMKDMLDLAKKAESAFSKDRESFKPVRRERIKIESESEPKPEPEDEKEE